MKMKWTSDKNNELELLYKLGINIKELSKKFDISENAVKCQLSKLGLTRYNRIKWTQSKLKELNVMYSNPCYSVREIADYFNTTTDNIRHQAHKNLMQKAFYEDIGKRECTRCGTLYPATNEFFYKNHKRKIGLDSWCKDCWKDYKRQLKQKNSIK